jgi:antitoxin MazE
MKTAVQRWGNSLALRIPKTYAQETRISEGSEVELTLKSGALIVKAVNRRRHSLSDLLKRVTPANRHAPVATGNAVGSEVW